MRVRRLHTSARYKSDGSMTREQFEEFLSSIRYGIAVRSPWDIVKCRCGDINCRGWRLVPRALKKRPTPQATEEQHTHG